ncbi:hypothetical protein DFH09DRAFT_1320394 [Mycena vulgaris]|nr:hypothetical protein DFH09DRAFT_1320394 [Mycena vulgaris]
MDGGFGHTLCTRRCNLFNGARRLNGAHALAHTHKSIDLAADARDAPARLPVLGVSDMTSRSFSSVIKDSELEWYVCLFYLILRMLNTIKDDMALPSTVKQHLLRNFHHHVHALTSGFALIQSGPGEIRPASASEQHAPGLANYDFYRHYVPGLLAHRRLRQRIPALATQLELSNSMETKITPLL